MNYKNIIFGLALVGSTILAYDIGKNKGYNQGFEDTKTEIRQEVVNLHKSILRREKDATRTWWNSWQDSTTNYTYHDLCRSEKDAFGECNGEISDLLDYRIDNLTKKDVIESAEFDKKYNK